MTPEIYQQLSATLQQGALPLSRLVEIAQVVGSKWGKPQLRLLLACLDGVEIVLEGDGNEAVRVGQKTQQEELADVLGEIVSSAHGQPLHPTEIRKRLPSRFVTTDEQIRALARKIPTLEVFGPGMIRLRK